MPTDRYIVPGLLAVIAASATACSPASFDLGSSGSVCTARKAVVFSDIAPRYPDDERATVSKVELAGAHDLVLVDAWFMRPGLGLAPYPPDDDLKDAPDLFDAWTSRKRLDEVVLEPGADEWSIATVVRMDGDIEHAWAENIHVHFSPADDGDTTYIGKTNMTLHLVSDQRRCEDLPE
ncbi:MAG: hypothetical protein GEU97_17485 [Actinophytocola sp.]|nr:hypothetical protein [Actinophytocola sp.]